MDVVYPKNHWNFDYLPLINLPKPTPVGSLLSALYPNARCSFLCGQHILENLTLHVPCDCKTTTERVHAACYRKYLLHTHVSCKSVLKEALRIPAWCCYYALAGAKINAKVTLSCILPLLSSCSWEDSSPCCEHLHTAVTLTYEPLRATCALPSNYLHAGLSLPYKHACMPHFCNRIKKFYPSYLLFHSIIYKILACAFGGCSSVG